MPVEFGLSRRGRGCRQDHPPGVPRCGPEGVVGGRGTAEVSPGGSTRGIYVWVRIDHKDFEHVDV